MSAFKFNSNQLPRGGAFGVDEATWWFFVCVPEDNVGGTTVGKIICVSKCAIGFPRLAEFQTKKEMELNLRYCLSMLLTKVVLLTTAVYTAFFPN